MDILGVVGINKGTWRDDSAYQGFYKGSRGHSMESVGHLFLDNRQKINVGSEDVIDFEVTYVKITLNRRKSGNYNNTVTGHLRYSNVDTDYYNGRILSTAFDNIDLNFVRSDDYQFQWLPINNTTVIEGSGASHPLCSFIKRFISSSKAKTLALYNGETEGKEWSNEYASCNYFNIIVKGNRTIRIQ